MAYDIGARIGLEGEAEFKRQLKQVNEEIKTLGTEMKVATSEFIGAEDSMEAYSRKAKVLEDEIDAQNKKLELLEAQLKKATDAYGKADSYTQQLQQQVNNTKASLNKLNAELKQTEDALEDVGKEAKDAGDDLEDMSGGFGGIKNMLSGAGGLGGLLTKGFAVGAVVGGIKEIGGAVLDLVDSTQEYRTIMASMESSSKRAGYTAEQTAEVYEKMQGVVGDSQAAAEATAQLQALNLSQEELNRATNITIGMWADMGQSAPIEAIAEATQQTISAGTATGALSDYLLAAGINEDEFNAKLQAANSTSERANIVMQELARQGLAEAGQAWIDTNQDIVQANRSTDEMDAALARLGGKLAPLAAGIRGFGADVINGLIDAGEGFIDWAVKIPEEMRKVGQNLITGIYNGISDKVGWLKSQVKGVVDKIKGWFTGSDGFDTHSPSKWSEKVFQNVMQGGAIGVDRGTGGLMKSVDSAVTSVKRDLSGIPAANVPVQGTGFSAGGVGGLSAADMAQAVKQALQGAGVYMDGRKVGQLVTTQQHNAARAQGLSPVYG